jgi:mannose-1-phosphate guanylyltransferase/mannose-6-phosphate isomerase
MRHSNKSKKSNTYGVLLAGGSGTRLWPLSRELYPKQLVSFTGSLSLIQDTIKRIIPEISPERLLVVCRDEHFFEISRHLQELGISPEGKVLKEPCGRNTAPAILLAIFEILKREKDAVILVFPSDHVIQDVDGFRSQLRRAISLAEKGYVVTFGITPDRPETEYGYIEGGRSVSGGGLRIKRFVEKPDENTAKEYLEAGNFFWNSGMFAFRASVMLGEFRQYARDIYSRMQKMFKRGEITLDAYQQLRDISIDYAIMEKTRKGVVLPSDFGWSDIGSWRSLYEFLEKDKENNVIRGDVITKNTRNCFIRADSRLVVTNDIENLVIVETPDTVFISDINTSKNAKSIVNELKKQGRKEHISHTTVYRPWGTYTVLLEDGNTKIKRIVVYPGAKLSHQMHHHRSEHWIVVQGTAKITNGDQTLYLKENQSTYVPKATPHRLENPGKIPLHIIEVQMGSYVEEDDIVRFDNSS